MSCVFSFKEEMNLLNCKKSVGKGKLTSSHLLLTKIFAKTAM